MSDVDRYMARVLGQDRARDGAEVRHVCPECGGAFADHLHASVFVVMCWACHGAGTLSDDQLTAYIERANSGGQGLIIS